MPTSAEALGAHAIKLPPEECMEVVEHILDSLGALWAEAADDRLAAYRSGEVKAIALSEVIAK